MKQRVKGQSAVGLFTAADKRGEICDFGS